MISSGCSLELASLRTRRNGLQPGGACSGRVELFSSHLSPFWPRSGPFSNLCGTHLPPLNPVEREREKEREQLATAYLAEMTATGGREEERFRSSTLVFLIRVLVQSEFVCTSLESVENTTGTLLDHDSRFFDRGYGSAVVKVRTIQKAWMYMPSSCTVLYTDRTLVWREGYTWSGTTVSPTGEPG